jgi:hypothetical protein
LLPLLFEIINSNNFILAVFIAVKYLFLIIHPHINQKKSIEDLLKNIHHLLSFFLIRVNILCNFVICFVKKIYCFDFSLLNQNYCLIDNCYRSFSSNVDFYRSSRILFEVKLIFNVPHFLLLLIPRILLFIQLPILNYLDLLILNYGDLLEWLWKCFKIHYLWNLNF